MDREQAIEKLNDIRCHVKETSTEEQALVMAIDALKAQLSMKDATKDATSDLISRTETVEHLRRVLEATVPNTDYDYDEGFIDGVKFGISTVSAMPIIQPVVTDTNVGDKISRQAVIDELRRFKPEIIPYEKARIYVEETVKTMYDRVVELPTIQPELWSKNDNIKIKSKENEQ